MPTLGKKISQLRKFLRLTQKEFAERAQISYRHFQNIEGDKVDIRLSTAEDIASCLMVPLPTLLDRECGIELFGSGIKDAWDILEICPVGLCVSNLEGRIIYLNSFFKKNFVGEQNHSKEKKLFVWDLLPEHSRAQGKLDFLKVIREKSRPKPGRRKYFGPDKKDIEVVIYWDYIYDEEKIPKGFVSAVIPLG